MKDFAAIDFETANGKRTSVCSVGIVIVKGGKIVNKIYRLIRPAPNYYTQWTTAIHGLTYDDTMEADDFPEVWAEIKPLLEGLPLVAHNSPFDEGCLRAVHELYGMTYPNYKFYCTCLFAIPLLHLFYNMFKNISLTLIMPIQCTFCHAKLPRNLTDRNCFISISRK